MLVFGSIAPQTPMGGIIQFCRYSSDFCAESRRARLYQHEWRFIRRWTSSPESCLGNWKLVGPLRRNFAFLQSKILADGFTSPSTRGHRCRLTGHLDCSASVAWPSGSRDMGPTDSRHGNEHRFTDTKPNKTFWRDARISRCITVDPRANDLGGDA